MMKRTREKEAKNLQMRRIDALSAPRGLIPDGVAHLVMRVVLGCF